jgi:replicative DNA helicase
VSAVSVSPQGRVPPHDLDAETSVLGAILLDPAAITRVLDQLVFEDFYRENNGQIYRAAQNLFREGEPIDNVTLAAELGKLGVLERIGGRAHLALLQESVPTAANVEHYARIVKDKAYKRRLISAGTQVAALGYDESLDAEEAVNQAQANVYAISDDKVGAGMERIYDLLKPAMDRIDAQMASGGGVIGIPSGFHDLDRMTNGFKPSDLAIIAGRPSMGKALGIGTPIPTPDGWTTMGALTVGDKVFDDQGRPCAVTFATPVMLGHDCYEVVFSDGERIIADADHQWQVWDHAARKSLVHYASGRKVPRDRNPYRGTYRLPGGRWAARGHLDHRPRHLGVFDEREDARRAAESFRVEHGHVRRDQPKIVTTRQMAESVLAEGGRRLNYSIPTCGALQYERRDLPLDAYVLGAWLGDGDTRRAIVTCGDREIVQELTAAGHRVREHPVANGIVRISFPAESIQGQRRRGGGSTATADELRVSSSTIGTASRGPTWRRARRPPTVIEILRELGVLGNKHVPRIYMEADVEQRLALLQGLMDTDGSIDKNGHAEFCSTSRCLADDALELARGLGIKAQFSTGRAMLNGRDCGPRYRVRFKTDRPVFRLPRKAARLPRLGPRPACRSRFVREVRPIESVPVRCIRVDSPGHLFLAGRGCVPTHNTSFVLNVTLHAAVDQKKPVAIFSLEMSKEQLVERMLCEQARIDAQRLHRGTLSDVEYERLAGALGPLGDAPIFIDDSPTLDDLTMRLKARQARSREGIELLVLDYLQLMTGRSSGGDSNRVQEVSAISRALKSIARELRIPVIAISQLSRAPEARPDKRPILSDLRESGSIEQDADIVMFLYRDEYYNREKSEKPGIAEIIVAKHRNGPTGMVELMFRKELTRFENLERRRPEPVGTE